MLIWYYGSTMILGAIVTNPAGERQSGATVTYSIRDRADQEVHSGTLTEVGDTGAYEDEVNASDILEEYGDEEAMRGLLYRARVTAELPNGVLRQSSPRINLQHDTD